MILASSFIAQVGEQLKAQSDLAQALVQDIAASELHAFRAFTNNPFYTSTVDQMNKCLQDIQAHEQAVATHNAIPVAAATPRTHKYLMPRKPDTSVFERLGMPQPLVSRIMHSTAQLCSIPGDVSVIIFSDLQLFPRSAAFACGSWRMDLDRAHGGRVEHGQVRDYRPLQLYFGYLEHYQME